MAASKNDPESTSESQSGLQTSSTDISPAEQENTETEISPAGQQNTEQDYLVLKDKFLPANRLLYPPRSSSLRPPPISHINSRTCDEADHTGFTVLQSQISHIFLRSKEKVGALFTTKTKPLHQPHSETPETTTKPTSNLIEQSQHGLTPIPGRRNKFWLGVPSQRTKDRAEKKMLRRMSLHTRERRSVTAESARKMLELEEEGVAVRDFQVEHDEVKEDEAKGKEAKMKEVEAEAEEDKVKDADMLEK